MAEHDTVHSVTYNKYGGYRAAALLILLICVFYAEGLFSGGSLIRAGNLYNDSLYRHLKPLDWRHSSIHDSSPYTHIAPWSLYAARSLRQGEIPLWNPLSGLGSPYHANWQTGIFSPLKIPLYLWPSMRIFEYTLLLRIFLAGLCALLMFQRAGLSFHGSLLGAVAYGFGGTMTVSFCLLEASTLAFLPLFFLAIMSFHERPSLISGAWLSLSVALLIFSGHPGPVFYALLGGGMFFLGLILSSGKVKKRKPLMLIGMWGMAIVSGLLLSSVVLLPFIENFSSGFNYLSQSPQAEFSFSSFLVKIMGGVVPFPLAEYPLPYMLYIGIFPLALALFSILGGKRQMPFLLVLLLGIAVFLRPPPFTWIMELPIFKHARAHYSLGLVSLSMAFLAGKGLDEWMKGKIRRVSLAGIGLALCALAFLLSGLAGLIATRTYPPAFVERLASLFIPHVLLALALSLSVAAVGARVRRGPSASMLILGLTFLDLFLTGFRYNRSTAFFEYPETPPIQWLKAQPGLYRVMGMEGSQNMPNTGLTQGLADLRNFDPLIPRRYAMVIQAMDRKNFLELGIIPVRYDHPLLDLLNVRYLIACRCRVSPTENEYVDDSIIRQAWHELPVLGQKWVQAYEDPNVIIYENTRVFPRAFVLRDLLLTKGEEGSLRELLNGKRDLRKEVILEVPDADARSMKDLPARVDGGRDIVRVVNYSPHRVTLHATLSSPGVLVMGDAYDPNWRCFVDGKRQRVYPADYILRGVLLREGYHEVEFTYDPWSFRIGAFLSLALLLLHIGFLACNLFMLTSNLSNGSFSVCLKGWSQHSVVPSLYSSFHPRSPRKPGLNKS